MAGSIDYAYDPNQIVYVINNICDGNMAVEKGTVIRVNGTALISETTVTYDIRLDGDSGTTNFMEDLVFDTKAEALLEYGGTIT